MGILRTDRVSGLGGANAIKGSVFFANGTGNYNGYLKVYLNSDNRSNFLLDGDFTIECWVFKQKSTPSGEYDGLLWISSAWRFKWQQSDKIMYYQNSNADAQFMNYNTNEGFLDNNWHHLAIVRSGNTITGYVDGTSYGTATQSNDFNPSTNTELRIGYNAHGFGGYISNLRVVKGTAVYTGNFTPPTSELTEIDGTVLLCCQSSTDVTQEATGNYLIESVHLVGTSYSGNAKPPSASRFTPNSPVGFSTTSDVGTQFGSTFNGVTTFDSQAYMVPPGGNTRERNRGRGVFGGGINGAPSNTNNIAYINIQSQGNTEDFGDLTSANKVWTSAFGSSTRAIWPGGALYNGTSPVDIIDFVTIATTSNATDFGDLSAAKTNVGSHSSQTRGVIAGGYIPSPTNTNINVIEFVTIATTGNVSDFGDITDARRGIAGMGSPTRAVYAGGVGDPAIVNTIDFVTIASTGDATDFGDMTQASRHDCGGCSSGTRGVIAGGRAPGNINTIQFLTIASAGNASDFGDLTETMAVPSSLSNSIRGVFSGSYSPDSNTISFVTIASTGNATDFGDNTFSTSGAGATSDSHGGLE